MKCESLLVCVLLFSTANTRSLKDSTDAELKKVGDLEVAETPLSAEQEEPKVECAPVKCDPSCHEGVGQYGCPTCICGPACSPPKCDPGCRIHLDPSLGPCPGCVCDNEEGEKQNVSSSADLELVPLSKCQCDWRYLKHYETKKCKPVFEEGCDCPIRFDCPELVRTGGTVCDYKGKHFNEGEEIETSSSCEICSCRSSFYGGVEMSCIPIECPSIFRPPLREACYEVYERNRCCSVSTECTDSEKERNVTEPTCEYGGRIYHLGQRIYPEEDPCMSCLCDENWAGVNSNSCHIHECLIERNLPQLRRGCIPIYHEKTCCPIEFHCGAESEENLNDTLVARSDGSCYFEGKSYAIGEQLAIHHPTNCVTCTCTTPPDFTCIHKSCPHPPNDDYENCRPNYRPGGCCPTYDCGKQFAPIRCEPVTCSEQCTEVVAPDGCSLCLCNQILCSPPKCPDGCEIEYNVSEGSCPHCKCPPTIQFAPIQCAPVNCGPQCFEAVGSNGCLTCICGPLCSPPKCDDGCTIQTDYHPGQCPGCVCPTAPGHDLAGDHQIQCAPVKCAAACREVEGYSGCPTCLCGPVCSPPNCPPGCEVETVPSSGPCPGCVCRDLPTHNIQCSPVKCDPGCFEATGQAGCPACFCDPLCSPPKCDPGCVLEHDPSKGPCPGCVCKREPTLRQEIQCFPVKCDPGCFDAIGQAGCPACFCDPLCSPPKCDPGCVLEHDPSKGPCPGCVCEDKRVSGIQCAPVKCGPTCREAIGQFGCPTCLCDPLCSPPKCDDPGCELETVPSSGPCPACVCRDQRTYDIQCAPVKCGPTCRETIGESGCPACVCDPLCSPPKCDPGCEVETVPSSGPCPGCVCPNLKKAELQCAPVKCGPTCREAVGQFGCPTCLCDPLCSPPKCDPGCEVETAPFSGPCPGCVCGQEKDRGVQCAPVKCGPECREGVGQFGCPVCLCGPLCSPPKCDPGCEVETVPSSGPCPGCVCKDQQEPKVECAPVKCEPQCREAVGQYGCPTCLCDPLCGVPKCDPGCRVEVVPSLGPCPGCVCDDQKEQSRNRRDLWNGY